MFLKVELPPHAITRLLGESLPPSLVQPRCLEKEGEGAELMLLGEPVSPSCMYSEASPLPHREQEQDPRTMNRSQVTKVRRERKSSMSFCRAERTDRGFDFSVGDKGRLKGFRSPTRWPRS